MNERKERLVPVTTNLTAQTLKQLKQRAKREKRTPAAMVRVIVEEYFQQQQTPAQAKQL